jgi:hypothetical protein
LFAGFFNAAPMKSSSAIRAFDGRWTVARN